MSRGHRNAPQTGVEKGRRLFSLSPGGQPSGVRVLGVELRPSEMQMLDDVAVGRGGAYKDVVELKQGPQGGPDLV